MDKSIWLMLLFQLFLIMLNAIFAAAEIAIVSMNDNKIDKMAKEGNKKAIRLSKLVGQPARFLATIQVAITLSGFLGSAFAADNFSGILVEVVLKTGINVSEKTLNSVFVILITLILSYFTLVFGELVPKRIAMQKSEFIALGLSKLIHIVSILFKPIVNFLTFSTNCVLKILHIDPNANDEQVSEEDIRMMIDVGNEKGSIDNTEKEFIQNVFEFDDLTANEIATHRTEMNVLWVEDDIKDWENMIHETRHKIYPVCNETTDKIVGLLNTKDFFKLKKENKNKEYILKNIIYPAYFVPENIKLDVLFKNMKQNKDNFAIVVDEYGGTTGIVTVYDLLEQLVGNFSDNDINNNSNTSIEQIGINIWKITGNPLLSEIEKELEISFGDTEYDTLTGLVFDTLGSVAKDGSSFSVQYNNLSIKISNIKKHQVCSATITKNN